MAINNNTRFLGIDSTKVNLTEKKDSVNNSIAQYFTAEEISANSLDIIANGSMGGPINIGYNVAAIVPSGTIGEQSLKVNFLPSINFFGDGGNSFTATSIVFPTLENAQSVNFNSIQSIITLGFPNLISAQDIGIENISNLTSLNFNSLVSCTNQLSFGNLPNVQLNFPLLKTARLFLNNSGFPNTLDSSVLPVIEKLGLNVDDNNIFNVFLPTVSNLDFLNFNGQNVITINIPNIISVSTNFISINNRPSMTSIILGGVGITKRWGGGNNPFINFSNNSLDQFSVDNILTTLASLDGTNGTTISNNGTLLLNGGANQVPSAAGSDARIILLNRGWNISTN